MTALADLETRIEGAPEGTHFAPRTIEEVVAVMRTARETSTPVRVWGGGTMQRWGIEPPPGGFILSTSNLGVVEAWEPDDLTVVVGAGISIGDLEARLGGSAQTAVLPENPGRATLGGVLATGRSPLRRARLLAPRERVLEMTLVTGDGRVIRSGGRVVKNVSGFDLHRAAVGAFGALGVIVEVCLKLWPVPPAGATIRVEGVEAADRVNRPLAVLETGDGVDLYLWGTDDDIRATMARVDGIPRQGLHWPEDPDGALRWLLRVPPASVTDAIDRLGDWRYLAIHGAGEIRAASEDAAGAAALRSWAESLGGALVLVDHPGEPPLDPWGEPPSTLQLQRRLVAEFDPGRIINPNRLPGGL